MARKSIEDVMNEIEDYLNSCKPAGFSSNKISVSRDEFDELFGELKVKIPAEIDRCKKIMRNKEAILMDARKNADGILAQAKQQAAEMVSETAIMAQANQQAYETVEMARVQANDMLAQAVAEANEIRLGSMQYTNDIMLGIRNYMEATLMAERANYENLMTTLENDFRMADANLNEIQSQIVEFTGNPNSVTRAPQMRSAMQPEEDVKKPSRIKNSVAQKVKQAVGQKEDKVQESKPAVNIPDFITNSDSPVVSNTKVEAVAEKKVETAASAPVPAPEQPSVSQGDDSEKKVKKKIIKKRNPVIHTPQTAQETVAKTLEAAASVKTDKTVYKANGEQAREVSSMEAKATRGPRVGRGAAGDMTPDDVIEVTEQDFNSVSTASGKSMGVVDDFSMEKKF